MHLKNTNRKFGRVTSNSNILPITRRLNIKLPDLKDYKAQFELKGVELPLPTVRAYPEGILRELPTPEIQHNGWPWTTEVDQSLYNTRTDWPKLTIVTPSFNQGQFIEQTIRAVLLQNYPNLEYIVIDGGSTDNTPQVLKKYEPWISYWHSEKDRGQSHAINQGFSLAAGTYYAWINSDDYYTEETFLKAINEFINSKCDFVYGYSLDYLVEEQKFRPLNKIVPINDHLIRFPSLAQPSCFWSAAIHQPIWEELHCSLDYELWLRMVKGQKKKLIKAPLSITNVHADAKTSDPKMEAKWQADHLLICSANAHGPVLNWNRLAIINRIRNKIYKWLN